jgi:subtilisin family serine protease
MTDILEMHHTTSIDKHNELFPEERRGGGTWSSIHKITTLENDQVCPTILTTDIEYEGDFARIMNMNVFNNNNVGCLTRLIEIAAMDPRVLSVTVEDQPILLNYAAKGILQSGEFGVEPFTSMGLTGDGEVVGVADSGLNDLSCFFYDDSKKYTSPHVTRSTIVSFVIEANRRKVIQYVANADGFDDRLGHGTHVCGSIAGNSLNEDFKASNGIVPNAKLSFFDLQVSGSSYVTLPDLYQYVYGSAYDAGARILSNSWGSSSSGGYTSRSYASDLFVYTRKDTLLVFAAGNSGAEDGDSSNFNPCISKNVICVGSTNLRDDSDDSYVSELAVSYFSSLGPTFDGRIKPDIVGPGFKIVSALSGDSTSGDSTCGVTEIQGTSMAAPLVSGAAVIVRQYFSSQLWTGICRTSYAYCMSFNPTGYLLKG